MRGVPRLLVIALIIAAPLLAGNGGRARADDATQVLTVTIAYPFVDPALNLNPQIQQSNPTRYLAAQMTQTIFTMFTRAHPGFIVKPLSWGWSDTLRQRILLAIAGGTTPDVITGEDFIQEFARNGLLAPVADPTLRRTLAAGPLAGGIYRGALYAIPAETGTFALFYNRALFRQAGLDPDLPPATWDAWLADSRKIAAIGNGISGTAVEAATGLGAAFRIAPFLRQLGGDFASPDGSRITFDSPANARTLTFLRQLAATAAPGVAATVDENRFLGSTWWAGKAGFLVNGPWEITSSRSHHLDFGVAPLPLAPSGHPANVVVGNQFFAAMAHSPHRQAALDFVRLLATARVARINYLTTGRLPANLDVLDAVVARPGGPLTVFADSLKAPGVAPLPSYAANPQKIWNEWYNAQLAALVTDRPIPDLLAQAQANADALLQQ